MAIAPVGTGSRFAPAIGGVRKDTHIAPVDSGPNFAPVPAPPIQPVHTKCMKTNSQGALCRAPRAKGTEFCIGHLRSMGEA